MNVSNLFISSSEQNPTGLQLLGHAKLTGTAASISVSGLPARTFLKIIFIDRGKTGADTGLLRFNADAGNNYSLTTAAGGTSTSQSGALVDSISGTVGTLTVCEVMNLAGMDKNVHFKTSGMITAATSAPNLTTGAAFWDNETDAISQVSFHCVGANQFAQNTELFVFGATS